jgi:uncharacterized protein YjdB
MKVVPLLAVVSSLLLCACSSPEKIEVLPKPAMITTKAVPLQLKATVKDSAGKVLSDVKVSYQALTPTILTVDATGKVRATHSGAGAVMVKAGKVEQKVEISVVIPGKIKIDPHNPTLNLGLKKNIKATLYNDRDKPMLAASKVIWSSSDPTVVSIDADGMIKTIKEGKATITAKAAGIQGTTVITVQHEKMQPDGYIGHDK